ARSIREMAAHLLLHGTLPENQQGKGAHHESLLLNPVIRESLQEWVKGGLEMRPAKMRRYLNNFLLPELKIDKTISESTAVRWLKKMGFSLCRVQKGVYVDGHERKDVVESREKLIEHVWLKVLPFCYQYEGKPGETLTEIAPVLQDGEKIHYPIAHDECCVHANDQANFEWIRDGEQPLRQKSRGRLVHVSSFILEHCGGRTYAENEWVPPPPPAPYTAYQIPSFDACRIIYPGANHDPWWDMPQLIAQVKDAIKIFNIKYPNGVAVFIFDCSSAHEAYSSDALLAHKMNRGSGGKQPRMRDTIIP
ncbi:hypothetical protein C8R44DRAFT_598557, partial [Mycena epipterygia]